ncbi:MAG TPA: DUF5677 domain-containing protein [Pseudolabrys sp.]|uniref:DUF5677 domain-containing protein n=1 Tax=Pseudolabrys sp. TaxID=1960880 RepID=UPI002DDD4790|nr:DUF5677 domain-containing protein [Pseudolabrys sp.]HEV2628842.1 DUF5677 domain-containing protein [Pseudolabrys sp.]
MDTLQKTIDAWLEQLPRLLFANLLDKKLRAQGIKLSRQKREQLADTILVDKLETFEFDDGNKNSRKRKISISFTDSDIRYLERKSQKFLDQFPALIHQITEKQSKSLLRSLKRKWPTESRAQRRDLDSFRKRLQDRWGDGLGKLRMLITIAREYGSETNNVIGRTDGQKSKKAFDILIKLHARSCQVAEEILCLLSNGFADGAMARWRTLHEIAAVGYLLQRHGDELAERYQHHEVIESRKAAIQYQRHQRRLGQRPLSDNTLRKIEADRASALALYGPHFANPQGWASKHLGKSNPSIADIQEGAGIDYLAPYYRMASHNVHANPKGVFFTLGLVRGSNTLLAGPSNAGLADPGHVTALSLVQMSSLLLTFCPTLDNQIAMRVMHALADEVGTSLLAAHTKLKADDRAFRRNARQRGARRKSPRVSQVAR